MTASESISRYLDHLGGLPLRQTLTTQAAIVASLAVATVLHMQYGRELDYHLLFLLPVVISGWRFGPLTGFFIAVLSSSTWFAADLTLRQIPATYDVANLMTRMGVFMLIALLIGRQKNLTTLHLSMALTDPLTGISNRRAFMEQGRRELARCRRYGQALSIVYLDVDNFKELNDNFGHKTGDRLLKLVAKGMTHYLRESDFPARLGGDEFAVLLVGADSRQAMMVMAKIKERLMARIERYQWPVSLSIGVITLADPKITFEEALDQADQAMYDAKQSGKNTLRHTEV